tara:strand:- start:3 stop:221 length:219 start_codon:yes stop_codon:yes gene_type:complete
MTQDNREEEINLESEIHGQFTGSRRGIIRYYRDLIKVCQANIGKTTNYGTVISTKLIRGFTKRLEELTLINN